MTKLTKAEIETAIETLTSAYTYDPPETWLSAFEQLSQVRIYLNDAQRSFRWVGLLGVLVGAGSAIVLFASLTNLDNGFGPAWMAALVTMVIAPDLSFAFSRWLAERREPLLKLRDGVHGALAKFREHPSVVGAEQRNARA